jgi:2-phospho-L-lactate guanylyltransferase
VDLAALIPVKSFRAAKARLTGVLTGDERARLARAMAARVIQAADPFPTFVACDHDEVATFAEELGATVLWGPGLGLNGAVDHGVATIAGKGFDHVVIAHGDLPLAAQLGRLARPDEIVIVPDRRRDGTNVLARPCNLVLPAAYGPGSFRSHYRAAVATGRRVTVRVDRRLAIDIDTRADCAHPLAAATVAELLGRPSA